MKSSEKHRDYLFTIQASKILGELGYKVNLITLNSIAYSEADDPEDPRNSTGINDMAIFRTAYDFISSVPLGADWDYEGEMDEEWHQQVLRPADTGWRKDQIHATENADLEWIEKTAQKIKLKPIPKGTLGGASEKKNQ